MTRKTALKLLASVACAMAGQRVVTAQHGKCPAGTFERGDGKCVPASEVYASTGNIVTTGTLINTTKVMMNLDLHNFDGFVIRNGPETITLTADEIWQALKDGK